MRLSEKMLGVFTVAGFDAVEADLAMNAVLAYVIGVAVSETAYLAMVRRSGSVEERLAQYLWHARHDCPFRTVIDCFTSSGEGGGVVTASTQVHA